MGKLGQTTSFNWFHVVGVFVMVLHPITTFIPTKHSFHLIKSKDTRIINPKTFKSEQWKGFIGFENIPSMSKVILYHWFFYIFLRERILGDVALDCSLHIPLFTLEKLRDTSMGDECDFNCQFFLASMPKPIVPHQVHHI
jgi:hypothetical protein